LAHLPVVVRSFYTAITEDRGATIRHTTRRDTFIFSVIRVLWYLAVCAKMSSTSQPLLMHCLHDKTHHLIAGVRKSYQRCACHGRMSIRPQSKTRARRRWHLQLCNSRVMSYHRLQECLSYRKSVRNDRQSLSRRPSYYYYCVYSSPN
jgi:hypothetical protein